jgi:cellulose synthase/poly-beta-1,6-N-acetylglucosamine synthase-like glycosyltransferase
MNAFALPLLVYYLAVIAVVCIYGLHRYWMVWAFFRSQRCGSDIAPSALLDPLPTVTVQLPMFNEKRVARRVIEAACAIDWPRELLQIQVLDDSTDESADIARLCCEDMAARGHHVQYLHRENRTGFKAGALANGLTSATGEFIAVFDADFVPPSDVLHNTISHFGDPRIGMVQTRWSHLNRHDSLLTRVEAMFLDGHFVIEQAARARNGRWFNFNGTAGVWRRSTIDDAGGWHCDTLTEDTDLSYRAQLRGWQFTYLPDVCCPAEVPPTVTAFLGQQHRWNKGLIQTAIKLLPRILTCDAPLRTKIEAWFHLTSPLMHLFIMLLVLLVTPTMFIAIPLDEVNPLVSLAIGFMFLLLGALAATSFYVASQWAQGFSPWKTILYMPALMAIGVGISAVNSRAVLEAILGRKSPFVRTPKYNGDTHSELDPLVHQRRRRIPQGAIEISLGLLMLLCAALSLSRSHTIVATPFLLLFACGFLAIGWTCLRGTMARASTGSLQPRPLATRQTT